MFLRDSGAFASPPVMNQVRSLPWTGLARCVQTTYTGPLDLSTQAAGAGPRRSGHLTPGALADFLSTATSQDEGTARWTAQARCVLSTYAGPSVMSTSHLSISPSDRPTRRRLCAARGGAHRRRRDSRLHLREGGSIGA